MQRVFPDGNGSFDAIDKGVDLWVKQFGGSTKVTFASDDLPLLKDSIISLWNRGIKEVNANVVFENVWKEGDDEILEDQLKQLADYVIDNELHNQGLYCSFFNDTLGFPYQDYDFDKTFCGAGKMMALSSDGDIYPCLRYYGHSLNNHLSWPIGNIQDGIDMERVRPFMLSTIQVQSDEECLQCDVASGCAFCQGFNYDEAETPTNFYRAKYICKMHKARVRANDYYFARLYNQYGIRRRALSRRKKALYILLSDDYVSYCVQSNELKSTRAMELDTIVDSLRFAQDNFYRPIFVHGQSDFNFKNRLIYEGYEIMHIIPAQFVAQAKAEGVTDIVPVFTTESLSVECGLIDNCILNVSQGQIDQLASSVVKLLNNVSRINLNITDINHAFDEVAYRQQLNEIKDFLLDRLHNGEAMKEVSLLTDRCFTTKHDNCQAGENTFAVSPSGELYTCAAVYSQDPNNSIGTVLEGITKRYDARLYKIESNNLCSICDAYQCKNCVVLNRNVTNEVNVPPSFKCRKSHIEREVSRIILEELKKDSNMKDYLNDLVIYKKPYLDPMKWFLNLSNICNDNNNSYYGFYKLNEKGVTNE